MDLLNVLTFFWSDADGIFAISDSSFIVGWLRSLLPFVRA